MIVIQLYSGFLQPDRISNGLSTLRDEVIRILGERKRLLNYVQWTDSTAKRAELIRNYVKANPEAKIFIVGHSFGGSTAIKLVEELRPLEVYGLFLADAVHNSGCKSWSAGVLPNKRVIHIPNNVKFVWAWRQKKRPPKGSKLQMEYPTLWKACEVVDEFHSQMDELPIFHNEFLREIRRAVKNNG